MKTLWIAILAALCIAVFSFGLLGGIATERLNTDIDLCDDESSGRYLRDAEARRDVCGPEEAPVLPDYLTVAGNQCPPWTWPDRPRKEFLTDSGVNGGRPIRIRGDRRPYRVTDVATILTAGERYAIPAGYLPGMVGDEGYEAAIRGDGLRIEGLPYISFWMPSLRYSERDSPPLDRPFCESGRPLPGPDEYTIGAESYLPGTPPGDAERAYRLGWLDRLEEVFDAPVADVFAGRVLRYASRLSEDVPGGFVYDGVIGLGPDYPDSPPSDDPLKHSIYYLYRDGLFGRLRCTGPSVVARTDPARAWRNHCELHVGPIDPLSRRLDVKAGIQRSRIEDWPLVYDAVVTLFDGWRMKAE